MAVNANSFYTQPPYLLQVEPADIFFTRGYGFFSKMIRRPQAGID